MQIYYLAEKGGLTGKTETTFGPADEISRSEFVTILARMSGAELPAADLRFTDVTATDWHVQYVSWAASPVKIRITVRDGRTWLDELASSRPLAPVPRLPGAAPDAAPAIELEGVWFRYEKDAPDVVKGLDFTVPAGSFTAVVGGNGTGKTTALSLFLLWWSIQDAPVPALTLSAMGKQWALASGLMLVVVLAMLASWLLTPHAAFQREVIQVPRVQRKLPKRTIAAAMILLLIPLTLVLGTVYLERF